MTALIELIASRRVRQIVNSLIQGSKTLTELSRELSITKPGLLKYLKDMNSRIIETKTVKTKEGKETIYNLKVFSILISAREGYGFLIESGEFDLEFPLLAQLPEEKRELKEMLRRILKIKQDLSVLLVDEDLLLLSDEWKEDEEDMVVKAAAPSKCLLWQYKDMDANDSFTRRIREKAIVIYAEDEMIFNKLGRYRAIE